MSRVRIPLLVSMTTLAVLAAGSGPNGCSGSLGTDFWELANNGLSTRLSVSATTITTGQEVTFTATVTDEEGWAPGRGFVADRFEWYVDGNLMAQTGGNSVVLSFDAPGSYLVELTVIGRRPGDFVNPNVRDEAERTVQVQQGSSGGTSGTGTGTTDDGADSVSVSISGPDKLNAGESGSYSASADGSNVNFTWDLLGDAATLGSSNGATTTVTGVQGGFATLVVEARDATHQNVLATAQKAIGILPEYVAWYTGNVDCWGAPTIFVSTRAEFNEWRAASSVQGGGIDSSVELEKVEMQGGFESREAANSWVCALFVSRKSHYWCGTHYNAGGQYYRFSGVDCDVDGLPWE